MTLRNLAYKQKFCLLSSSFWIFLSTSSPGINTECFVFCIDCICVGYMLKMLNDLHVLERAATS